jgi:hypothetical protein
MKHDILSQAIRPLPPPDRVAVKRESVTAFVLHVDIVRPADNGVARRTELRRLGSLIKSTSAFQAAMRNGNEVSQIEETGYTVVFFGWQNGPVQCAVDLLKSLSEAPEKMTVRIGISQGLVTHIPNGISGADGVSGAGVEEAMQVANLSGPSQILLSDFRDFLNDSEWKSWMHDLGKVNLKRDISTRLCNLAKNGFGNPGRPWNWAFLKAKHLTGKELRWAGTACAIALLMAATAWTRKMEIVAPPRPGPLIGIPEPTGVVGECAPGPESGPVNIEDHGFVSSGWMGDAVEEDQGVLKKVQGVLKVDSSAEQRPGSSRPHSQKWTYQQPQLAKKGWAAVAWQCGENNFGEKTGKVWTKLPLSKVSFWVRGVKDDHGHLPKVTFEAGGPTEDAQRPHRYQTSFKVPGDYISLNENWREHTIDLRGKNLSQVIVAFVFVIRNRDMWSDSATFFLDDIIYE